MEYILPVNAVENSAVQTVNWILFEGIDFSVKDFILCRNVYICLLKYGLL